MNFRNADTLSNLSRTRKAGAPKPEANAATLEKDDSKISAGTGRSSESADAAPPPSERP